MENAEPKVSILVPIYNVEHYLRKCLDSLTAQTLYDVEIICIDDGSTDASAAILAEYAAKDARIITLSQANAGQASARNAGLRIARAPYIMFCDADDWCAAEMCEKMVAAIESEEGVDLAMCGANIIYESDKDKAGGDAKYFRVKYSGVQEMSEEIVENTDVCLWNKIFRRERLESLGIRFPEGMKYEDVYFTTAYMMGCRRVNFIQEKLYNYIRRAESTMGLTFSGKADYLLDHLRVMEKLYEYMKERGMQEKWKRNFGVLFFRQVDSCLACAHSPEERDGIFDYAESFITQAGLDFSDDEELQYARRRVSNRMSLGEVRKKWFGLLRIKQKRKCIKYYFCGICCGRSKR